MIKPEKGYFSGKLYKALIMDQIQGGVVIPNIPNYPKNLIEIVSPVHLRDELNLKDGDIVEVKIFLSKN